MIDTMKNKITGPEEVVSKYGLKPNQMIDYFALLVMQLTIFLV